MRFKVVGKMNVIVSSDITIKNLSFKQIVETKMGESLIDKVFEDQYSMMETQYTDGKLELIINDIIILDPNEVVRIRRLHI